MICRLASSHLRSLASSLARSLAIKTKTFNWQLKNNGHSELWIWRVLVSRDETELSGSWIGWIQSSQVRKIKILITYRLLYCSKEWKELMIVSFLCFSCRLPNCITYFMLFRKTKNYVQWLEKHVSKHKALFIILCVRKYFLDELKSGIIARTDSERCI